jgi:hypothetical protein
MTTIHSWEKIRPRDRTSWRVFYQAWYIDDGLYRNTRIYTPNSIATTCNTDFPQEYVTNNNRDYYQLPRQVTSAGMIPFPIQGDPTFEDAKHSLNTFGCIDKSIVICHVCSHVTGMQDGRGDASGRQVDGHRLGCHVGSNFGAAICVVWPSFVLCDRSYLHRQWLEWRAK